MEFPLLRDKDGSLCMLINGISLSHLKNQSVYLSSKSWSRITVERKIVFHVAQVSFCFLYIHNLITTVAGPLSAGLMTISFSAILWRDRRAFCSHWVKLSFTFLINLLMNYLVNCLDVCFQCWFSVFGWHQILVPKTEGIKFSVVFTGIIIKNTLVGGGADRKC